METKFKLTILQTTRLEDNRVKFVELKNKYDQEIKQIKNLKFV